MDALIAAATLALATGDPLRALQGVALRDDAPALALRGIAMAQLGDLTRARAMMRRAARAFGSTDTVAHARCLVAQAEIALASRELEWPVKALDEARATLALHGDTLNAAHAACLQARRLLLLGRSDDAANIAADLGMDPQRLPPALTAMHELTIAGIAIRRTQAGAASAALTRATVAAAHAAIPALQAEVQDAALILTRPAAHLITTEGQTPLWLNDVEALLASGTLVIDACRYTVRHAGSELTLARRPILFSLARALGQAWPGDISRHRLITQVFQTRYADETHRVRLRVEIARLRAALTPFADISATAQGFRLSPRHSDAVAVLGHPMEEKHAAILALLADGQPWASSALAIALNTSQRTIQRALDALSTQNRVQSFGQARARRWLAAPLPGFTTTLLLPSLIADH